MYIITVHELYFLILLSEVFFNQENSSVEIGRPFSMTCTVSGVRDLASIRLYHGEKLLCRLVIDMIIFNDPNITCKGSLGPSNGSLQIDFSLVRCSDEGEYSCVPNTEASTTKTTFLIVTSKYFEIAVETFSQLFSNVYRKHD